MKAHENGLVQELHAVARYVDYEVAGVCRRAAERIALVEILNSSDRAEYWKSRYQIAVEERGNAIALLRNYWRANNNEVAYWSRRIDEFLEVGSGP